MFVVDINKLLVVSAILPPLYLIIKIISLDRYEKEPASVLIKCFLLGVIAILPALFLEILAASLEKNIFNYFVREYDDFTSTLYLFIEYFFGVALIEEGSKFVLLKLGTYKSKSFDYYFDGIVYATLISLGFATGENIAYVLQDGFASALARAFTAIPGHACFGVYMGAFYASGRYYGNLKDRKNEKKYLLLAVLMPFILHGIYDYSLSLNNEYSSYFFIGYILFLNIFTSRFINNISKYRLKITVDDNENNFIE